MCNIQPFEPVEADQLSQVTGGIGPFYPYPQVPLGWRKVTLDVGDTARTEQICSDLNCGDGCCLA